MPWKAEIEAKLFDERKEEGGIKRSRACHAAYTVRVKFGEKLF